MTAVAMLCSQHYAAYLQTMIDALRKYLGKGMHLAFIRELLENVI